MAIRACGVYIPPDRINHFAKRATPAEVEEVLENEEWPAVWKRVDSLGQSPAYHVFGRTAEGRYLFIPGILMSEPPLRNFFMPATVRPMTRTEKEYYHRHVRRSR